MNRPLAVAALALWSAAPVAAKPPETIYGDDDRQDVYEVGDSELLRLADSTVALFWDHTVLEVGDVARLVAPTFGASYNLCPGERFREQPAGASCSGALIAPDLVLTAGHCVRSAQLCRSLRFVFGYAVFERDRFPVAAPKEEVYRCAELVSYRYNEQAANNSLEWAIVRLDRPVENHAPLELDWTGEPAAGSPVVIIGHPSGLPTKIAADASVLRTGDAYFEANLDSFGGNSGSPVFDLDAKRIVGVLTRGYEDFERRPRDEGGECQAARHYEPEGLGGAPERPGAGQHVAKVSAFAWHIPGSPVGPPDRCEAACLDDAAAEACVACRREDECEIHCAQDPQGELCAACRPVLQADEEPQFP